MPQTSFMDRAFLTAIAAMPKGPLLGLDPGSKTIGVAVSTPERRLATPVTVIRRTKFGKDAEALFALAEARGVVGLIIGVPLNMDGSEGPRAQSARTFGRNLSQRGPLPVAYWDERLSSVAAERALLATDTSRARRAEVIDAHAATHILQGALDRLATNGHSARA
nr:Holliday junction resolvase RuvX [Parvularcula bermudensis]